MDSKYANAAQDARSIDTDERTDRETNDNTISDYCVLHLQAITDDERKKLVDHEQDNSAQNESQSKPLTKDNEHVKLSNLGFSETNVGANLNNSSNHSKTATPSEYSNFSSTSSVKTYIKPKKRTLCVFICCVSGTSSVIVAIVTTMLVLVLFTGPHSPLIKVQNGNTSTASPIRSEKLTGNGATFSCAQLYLDMERFKEAKTMRWVYGDGACSSYSHDVTTDDYTSRITIQHSGLYSIRSKITFNLRKQETTNTLFHSVVLNRKGSRRILEKNTRTLVDSSVRPDSFKMPSSIFVLATLRAGDQIYIGVLDEALVFPSRVDNTLQLIRYM